MACELLVLHSRFMRAVLGVEAGVGQLQALDGTTVEDVFIDDLIDVFKLDEAVPDRLGIDGNDGTVFALVEASGLVGTDMMLEARLFEGVLEGVFELFAALGPAAWAWSGLVTLVGTDEDVVIELWHSVGFSLVCCKNQMQAANASIPRLSKMHAVHRGF